MPFIFRINNGKLSWTDNNRVFPNNNLVDSTGLVVNIKFSNPSCYSGTGTTFYNLIDNAAQSIFSNGGSYTYDTDKTLKLTNNSSTGAAATGLLLKSYNIQTVSIWLKINSMGSAQYVLDGRTTMPSGYVFSGGIGSNWTALYVNGVSTSVATGTNAFPTSTNSNYNNYNNVVLIADNVYNVPLYIATRYVSTEGLNCNIAYIHCYNYALSQSTITSNYNAMLGSMP